MYTPFKFVNAYTPHALYVCHHTKKRTQPTITKFKILPPHYSQPVKAITNRTIKTKSRCFWQCTYAKYLDPVIAQATVMQGYKGRHVR